MTRRFKKIRNFGLAGLLGCSLAVSTLPFLAGCERGGENSSSQVAAKPVPNRTSNASFSENGAGVGGVGLWSGDAYYLEDNGYSVYDGHGGGYGDTLELVDYDDGISFSFAYGDLMSIGLSSAWQGRVEGTDIRIGASSASVLAKYPNAVRLGNTLNVSVPMKIGKTRSSTMNYCLRADLEGDLIKRIRLDVHDLDNYNVYSGAFR